MDKSKSVSSYLALTALFVIGNSIINLPFKEHTEGSILGFFIALILSIPFYLKFSFISLNTNKIYNFLFLFYAVFIGLTSYRNFVTFSDKVILPEASLFLPTLAFTFLLYKLSKAKFSAILKMSFILLTLSAAVVIFLLILSADNIKLSNIIPPTVPNKSDILYQTAAYFSMSFIEGIILIPFNNNENRKGLFYGFLIGAFIIFLSIIQILGVLGYGTTAFLSHPYSSSVSTITVSSKFSRMEGFSYLLFFSATLIKTSVSMKAANIAYTNIFKKGEKFFLPAITLVYFIFAVFTDIFINLPFTVILPFLTFPALILTWFTLPAKRHTPLPDKTTSTAQRYR